MPATFNMTEKLPITVEYRDSGGNLADIQDLPTFDSSDAAVFTFDTIAHPSLGTYTAFAVSQGIGNDVSFTISADGDLGEGVMTISINDMLSIVAAGASTVSLAFGAPVPK